MHARRNITKELLLFHQVAFAPFSYTQHVHGAWKLETSNYTSTGSFFFFEKLKCINIVFLIFEWVPLNIESIHSLCCLFLSIVTNF
jgi:hypothetical protein